jgi:hypothetical protein
MVPCSFSIGCNVFTGADDLAIGTVDRPDPATDEADGGDGGDGEDASGPGGDALLAASGASTSGSGGAASTGSSGAGAAGAGPPGPSEPMVGAPGVTLTAVEIYQAVRRPMMHDGKAASSPTPVVADRAALVRAYYQTDGAYDGAPVTGRLTIGSAVPMEATGTLGAKSDEASLASTVNFEVPGALVAAGAGYRVELLQPAASAPADNPAARWPQGPEPAPLEAMKGGTFHLTLVPVKYDADGSGRLPDTSAAQVKAYTDAFYVTYPAPEIVLKVRAPMPWGQIVSSGGGGWGALLNAVADQRLKDGVPSNEYYYGIVAPAATLSQYCGGGCVMGIAFLAGPSEGYARAAVGAGYSGGSVVSTALQEVGHALGRAHAPCGAPDIDPNYPYPGAKIGARGYSLLSKKLFDPSQYVDFMSYCGPVWISDYTFRHLFLRLQDVNGVAAFSTPSQENAPAEPIAYDRILVSPSGATRMLEPVTLARPAGGERVEITADARRAEGFLVRDSLGGGVVLVPPGDFR